MRYKTLFRVLMKVLGVYLIVTSSAGLLTTLVNIGRQMEGGGGVMLGFVLQSGLPRLFATLFVSGSLQSQLKSSSDWENAWISIQGPLSPSCRREPVSREHIFDGLPAQDSAR